MKVILNSDVANLGEEGDVCTVKPGYARNYLLPQGLVLEYNERNRKLIEERRSEIESRKEYKRKQAASIKEQIETEPLVVHMTAGANGKLFGSVTSATITEALEKRGIQVERKKIEMPESSIKTLGNFKVRLRLYGDEEATLTVTVEPSNPREIQEQNATKKPAPSGETEPKSDDSTKTPGETGVAEEGAGEDEQLADAELDPEVMAMRAAEDESEAEE